MNDNYSQDQARFLDVFPFDITTEVFSYLDQQDCLNCMATCRTWYNRLPQYTNSNWKTVELYKHNAQNGITQRLDRCLGKHVKHVKLCKVKYDTLFIILRKLKENGCDEIESLEFVDCFCGKTKYDQIMFMKLLQPLAHSRLVHLKMENFNWHIALLGILALCPHLMYFTYRPEFSFYNAGEKIFDHYLPVVKNVTTSVLRSQHMLNHLIHLNVDAAAPFIRDQTRAIVQKCPNLMYFISPRRSCIYLQESVPHDFVSLDYLLTWCPKLIRYDDSGSNISSHGEYNYNEQITYKKTTPVSSTSSFNNNNDQISRSIQQQNTPCIQHLALCEYDNIHNSTIHKYLHNHQDTLEHLSIVHPDPHPNPFNWSFLFQTINLCHLRALYLGCLKFDINSLMALLNSCQNTIEEVYLNLQHRDIELNEQAIQQLQILPKLHKLTLHRSEFSDESSVLALLERVPNLKYLMLANNTLFVLTKQAAPLLKNLEQMDLWSVYPVYQDGQDAVLTPSLFDSMGLLHCGYELKRVRLMNVPKVKFQVLFGLAELPNLTSIEIMPICTHFSSVTNFRSTAADKATLFEQDEKDMLCFFNALCGRPSGSKNFHKKKSQSVIENLKLGPLPCNINYAMLDALGDLPCLKSLRLYLERFDAPSSDTLVSQEKGLVNVDLSGVIQLLHKSPKLKTAKFRRVESIGDRMPSEIINDRLMLEKHQGSNKYSRLQQYAIHPENSVKRGRSFHCGSVYITRR